MIPLSHKSSAFVPSTGSNLGIGGWAQKDVADIADDFSVGVTGGVAQFLPFRVRNERGPILVVGCLVFEDQHVSEVGQARADQSFAEKDRLQTVAAKDGDF